MNSHFRRILTIARKEITVLFAKPLERKFIIIPPIVLMFVFSWAATMEVRNVDVAIWDRDHGVWSQNIVQAIQGSPLFRSVKYLDSPQQAQKILDRQQSMLLVSFGDDFSRRVEACQVVSVQVIIDGRKANAAQIVQAYIMTIINEVTRQTPLYEQLADGEEIPRVQIETVNWFNPNLDFTWFYLPNLIGMISMFMCFILTGLSVARERELGTFDQMLVSPASPTEIAIAKLIPGGLVAMAHGTVFLLGAHFYFKIPFEGSLVLLYAAMLVFAIACCGIGLMISSIVATQQQAFLGCFIVAVPLVLLSGFVAPVTNMPLFFQYLGQADPLRHFMSIIQGVFLKDVSWDKAQVDLGKMLIISVVTSVVAVRMFKKRV